MVQIRMLPSEPALSLVGSGRHLVIADVHIGFESRLASAGICLGKESAARKSAKRVLEMMRKSKLDSLVLLGDVKSGTDKITDYEWCNVPQFFDELGDIDIILIPGNHDGNISKLVPEHVSISGQSGVVIDRVLLTHGHAMPSDKFSAVGNIVMGHVHPTYSRGDSVLNGRPVWAYLQANRECIFPSGTGSIGITVMPSFNEHLHGGRRKLHKRTSPILRRALQGLLSAKIVSMDGAILCNESEITAAL